MLKWVERWMLYTLIPAGCVLLFVPLTTYRTGTVAQDFVFFEAAAASAADSRDCPVISDHDLNAHAALREQVVGMARWRSLGRPGYVYRTQLDDAPADEWMAFRTRLQADGGARKFRYGNDVFRVEVTLGYRDVRIEVPHLRTACKALGVLFLLLGLVAVRGLYATQSNGGIQVGRRSAMILWDVLVMLTGITFTWWVVEFVLAKGFQTASEWDEDFAAGMGIVWMVFIYPVVALVVTATSLQTLRVSGDAIVLGGMFGDAAIRWPEVESIRVSQLFSARGVIGVPAPKRVMKILEISGGGAMLRVMEPPFAATKKEILRALIEHAPEDRKPQIEVAAKEWVSLW